MNQVTDVLENGNKVHYTKHPRYGLWSVSFDRGGIPASLDGMYQSLPELQEKVEYYLSIREKNRTKVKREE